MWLMTTTLHHAALESGRVSGLPSPASSICMVPPREILPLTKPEAEKLFQQSKTDDRSPSEHLWVLRRRTHTLVSPILVTSLPRCCWCCRRSLWKCSCNGFRTTFFTLPFTTVLQRFCKHLIRTAFVNMFNHSSTVI